MTAKKMSKAQIGKRIGAFLTALETGDYASDDASVVLGRLPGFPMATRDPVVVENAADEIIASTDGESPMKQLKKMQRATELRREAERLRSGGSEYLLELRQFFVDNAADYFAEAGVEYGTLREWNGGLLSAKLLKEAGVR